MKTLFVFLIACACVMAEDKSNNLSKDEQIAVLKAKIAVQQDGINDLTLFLKYYQDKPSPAVAAMNLTVKEIETKHNCKILEDLTCKPNEERKAEEKK